MMTETNGYGYARGDGYLVVDVPYSWGELSMTILLPDEGTLGAFEDSLDLDLLYQITDGIATECRRPHDALVRVRVGIQPGRYPGWNGDARRL